MPVEKGAGTAAGVPASPPPSHASTQAPLSGEVSGEGKDSMETREAGEARGDAG